MIFYTRHTGKQSEKQCEWVRTSLRFHYNNRNGLRECIKKERELEFMWKIVIQNQSSETIIHNVSQDELEFWKELLEGHVQGEIKLVDTSASQEVA